MIIKLLDNTLEEKYEEFLLGIPESLFFASNKLRHFLREFLGAEDAYFLSIDENGNIVAALPSFLKKNDELGNVLNSLPFYGSNGGIIETGHDEHARLQLLQAYYAYANQKRCVSSTIISSPLSPLDDFYEVNTSYTLKDSRIGQLTPLPDKGISVDDSVMKVIHYKTRNLVRKAQKLEITIDDSESQENMDFLISTHHENMRAIGGLPKPENFFRLVPVYFQYGTDYKIYTARHEGKLIAAVLVFYFNKTVEYFTPVIKAEYRNFQPMSLLIFEAMKDAVVKGFHWWNWGGTWISQGGVYHFKSQWGTRDINYYYYTRIFETKILEKTKEELLQNYPYFFVAPFNALVSH
ncbi:MAG: GNAT family N-acetyltransferase [Bacteroidetes bacterium]|nr:GNAT family N-acetyltransferase [Bacteroidota bacterium]